MVNNTTMATIIRGTMPGVLLLQAFIAMERDLAQITGLMMISNTTMDMIIRVTMLRATMRRVTMLRVTMLRVTMLRVTMPRVTMPRVRMPRVKISQKLRNY